MPGYGAIDAGDKAMTLPYLREVSVEWGDADPFGLVYFPRILEWFNDAEHEFFAKAGFPVTAMIEQDVAFVMGRINFDFVGPAPYGERIVTRLALDAISNSTITWGCSARRKRDDVLVTEGQANRVYAAIQPDGSLRAEAIPAPLRTILTGGS